MNKNTDKVVCVCPTCNRRFFFPTMLYQFAYQTYPKQLLDLIILDDSDESNQDIIDNISVLIKNRIHYFYDPIKKSIGQKRNILNQMAIIFGTKYIVLIDDDDYYPSTRIEFAINMLKKSNYLICGTSVLPIYNSITKSVHVIGPFINKFYPGHASCGTLVYDVKYLENHNFNDNDFKAEEKTFLHEFKAFVLQLPYNKVMLCISHKSNTVNKTHLLNESNLTKLKLQDIITNKLLYNFYSKLDLPDIKML